LGDALNADFRKLISRADLDYDKPATRSEEGQPIGNGRMGSLVWTTPSALHFQINRVDVFGQNSYTTSFPKQDSDYASGCGYVDVNLVDAGDDIFTGDAFNQHLSLYDAQMTARGKSVTARCPSPGRRATSSPSRSTTSAISPRPSTSICECCDTRSRMSPGRITSWR
jgi:hypothetical protein